MQTILKALELNKQPDILKSLSKDQEAKIMQQRCETRQQPLKKIFKITDHNIALMWEFGIIKELLKNIAKDASILY
jgi:hypothetical protein